MNRAESRVVLLAVALAAALVLPGLGRLALWSPDEPRIAEVAQELASLEHGAQSLVLLRLHDEPYSQKPPLYYWLAALVGLPAGGVDEWAARIPSALSAVALVGLTCTMALRLFPREPRAALWAAIVLLSGLRFTQTARRAQLDVLLALCESAAIYAFIRSSGSDGSSTTSSQRRSAAPWISLALALGLLTKGPVALLVLPAIAMLRIWEGEAVGWRQALASRWTLLCVGPVLLWLGAALAAAPAGFADEAVFENLFGRFFAGSSHARPLWYFARQWPLDFLPWTPVAVFAGVAAWRGARGANDSVDSARNVRGRGERWGWRLLVAWVGVQVIFFSLSTGKRGLYLLPIYPPISIACGVWLERGVRGLPRLPRAVIGSLGVIASVAGLAALLVALGVGRSAFVASGLDAAALQGSALACVVAIVAAAALVTPAGRWRGARGQLAVLCGGWLALLAVTLHGVLPAFDAAKSPAPVIRAAERVAGSGPIGLYQQRASAPGLVYYGGRGPRGLELLATPSEIAGFWARGGGAMIVRSRQLHEIDPKGERRVAARLRSGRRELLVVVPRAPDES